MRQQQRETRGLSPLGLTRDDKLIDDDLRAVVEIAELRFPQDERFRNRSAIAVLETETRVLRERTVVNFE